MDDHVWQAAEGAGPSLTAVVTILDFSPNFMPATSHTLEQACAECKRLKSVARKIYLAS
jgi:hypothetical protein